MLYIIGYTISSGEAVKKYYVSEDEEGAILAAYRLAENSGKEYDDFFVKCVRVRAARRSLK